MTAAQYKAMWNWRSGVFFSLGGCSNNTTAFSKPYRQTACSRWHSCFEAGGAHIEDALALSGLSLVTNDKAKDTKICTNQAGLVLPAYETEFHNPMSSLEHAVDLAHTPA